MATKKVSRWLRWVALLAAPILVPACTMSGTGGGSGSGNLLWKSITGGGGPPDPTGLVWRDPNFGPISGGGGLGGDMTFEQAGEIDITNGVATTNPFKGDLHPVSVALAQSSQEEQTLESIVSAWYANYARSQINPTNPLNPFGPLNMVPLLNPDPKIELEGRADCENCAIQNTTTPSETTVAPNSLKWRLEKCGVNPNLGNPTSDGPDMATDSTAWWNAHSTNLQNRLKGIQGSGYFGAGYWTLNNQLWYAVAVLDLPLGQVP